MPDGKATPLEPGLIARVAQGLRYVVSGVTPETFFGPEQPLPPLAQSAEGRQFDYPVGYNLRSRPREDEALGFRDLRALADTYDLLRLVIETRKDQVARLRWTIRPRDEYRLDPADPRILGLRRFFSRPDREHGWSTWLRLLLEDMLVLDAPCLFRRKTLDGSPFAFEIMDGALIKRVIDARGRTPLPPDPAYQQILKGLPAVDYTTDELLYLPRNPRPNRLYGCSPVEQIVMTVNIALRRQASQLAYFTEGNTPEALVGVPPDWTPDQIGQFQLYWDSLLAGDLDRRRHTRFVPGGLEYHPTREPVLKDVFDDWLARVVCFAFSVSPTALVAQVNRATADSQKQSADEEGLAPVKLWVKELVDRLIEEDFGYQDLEFGWTDDAPADPATLMSVNTGYVAAGIKTINEARAEIGLGPLPGGDTPEMETPTGPVPLGKGFNPDQPRDADGRWTDGDDERQSTTSNGSNTVISTSDRVDADQVDNASDQSISQASVGRRPPPPPDYDPNTWTQGELDGKVTLTNPAIGITYLEHIGDEVHWPHWDIFVNGQSNSGRVPENSVKPNLNQKRLGSSKSWTDPTLGQDPWAPALLPEDSPLVTSNGFGGSRRPGQRLSPFLPEEEERE